MAQGTRVCQESNLATPPHTPPLCHPLVSPSLHSTLVLWAVGIRLEDFPSGLLEEQWLQ